MADYISRDEAIERIQPHVKPQTVYGEGYLQAIEHATAILELMPAADVQPVKHGEWDFQGYQLFKCTNCKEIFTQNQLEAMQNHINQEEFTFPNFCPNCGADMRGDTNE